MTALNTNKHLEVFDPEEFADRKVDVIGVGATGSHAAYRLAKLGVKNLHIWDPDVVEGHNIANQAYIQADIGKPKVEALAEHILAATGTKVTAHQEWVDGNMPDPGEVVFLLVDTMRARKEIFGGALELNMQTELLVETRMDAAQGRVYGFNPNDPDEVKRWTATLCEDPQKAVSACGMLTTVGATAGILADLAVWSFIRWFGIEYGGKEGKLDFESIIFLDPLSLIVS